MAMQRITAARLLILIPLIFTFNACEEPNRNPVSLIPEAKLSDLEGLWTQSPKPSQPESLTFLIDSVGNLSGFNHASLCSCWATLEHVGDFHIFEGTGQFDSLYCDWTISYHAIPSIQSLYGYLVIPQNAPSWYFSFYVFKHPDY
ncbi:hypothetical protein ACFL41_01785 [Gemmatimonadota bacterium]